MGTELEVPAWPAIALAEAQALLARLPEAGAVTRLAWHSPRPFSSAALVETSNGALFVKRHAARVRSVAGLAAEHAFVRHCADHGVPVPALLTDAGGQSALAGGDWTWEVHLAGEGADLYRERPSWTPYLSAQHAHAAGAALAALHRAAASFAAPPRPAEPLVSSATILRSADPMAAARHYIGARPALSGYLAGTPWQEALAARFAHWDAAALAQRLQALPAQWGHNDWHPSNLLWRADGTVAAVLDFGLADAGGALFDLAIAIERACVTWLDPQPEARIADAEALLAGYGASAAERAVLARLLPLVHIEFALSEVDYFHGVLGRRGDADLAWHGYALGHADWFARAPGAALLAAIAGD